MAMLFTAADIRDLRMRLGLTPTQFAAKIGVTENTVRRWEIGDRRPKLDTMEQLNILLDEINTAANGRKKATVA